MRSKVWPSRRISFGPRSRFKRADRSCPSEMEPAFCTMVSIGWKAFHAMSQPPPTEINRIAGSSVHVSTMIVCMSPLRSAWSMTPRTQSRVTLISTSTS